MSAPQGRGGTAGDGLNTSAAFGAAEGWQPPPRMQPREGATPGPHGQPWYDHDQQCSGPSGGAGGPAGWQAGKATAGLAPSISKGGFCQTRHCWHCRRRPDACYRQPGTSTTACSPLTHIARGCQVGRAHGPGTVTAHTQVWGWRCREVSSSSSCLRRGEGPYRLVSGEWGVARHEEVQAGCGDERGDEPDEVVVHVAGIPERGGAGRHDGGDLWRGRGQCRGTARSRRTFTSRITQPCRGSPCGAAPGKGRGPLFMALGAHHPAQPTGQVRPESNTAGMPHATFSPAG